MAGTLTLEVSGGGIRPLRMQGSDGDVRLVFGRFLFDSSYVTGGESLTNDDLNVNEILTLIPSRATGSTGGALGRLQSIDAVYDYTNETLIAIAGSAAYASAGGFDVEVAHTTDLSAFTVRFIAVCR